MKQSILLISACLVASLSQAQENTINSILYNNHITSTTPASCKLSDEEMTKLHNLYEIRMASQKAAAKTTSSTISDWYDLMNQNYHSSSTGTAPDIAIVYYWACYPDSTVKDASSTPYNIFVHGMGNSFDPTDSSYYDYTVNTACLNTGAAVSLPMSDTGQTYTIDSIYVPVTYTRLDNTVNDSLIIELVTALDPVSTTTDTGAYNLQFTTYNSAFLPWADDGKPRFADVHYNSGCGMRPGYAVQPYINDCYYDSVFVGGAYKQRFAFGLTATTAGDTTQGYLNLGQLAGGPAGYMNLHINPVTLKTSRHQHLVTFVSFKSGKVGGYPLGTTTANWIKLFAGSPRSTTTGGVQTASGFTQNSANAAKGYNGSYQATLIDQQQTRYSDTAFTYPAGKHDILIPSSDFASPDFVVMEAAYHVTWTANPTLSINKVNNTFDNVNVYPNPATSTLNITFTSAATVNVTLTNLLGQVVASQNATNGKVVFNTTELPAGVYVFTLTANGEHTTGRVVIAH